jgi:predicted dehydrogenase
MHELRVLAAVVDSQPSRLTAASENFGVPGLPRLSDLIQQGRADAVAIATPSESHHPLAMEALGAGLDVFVEKPMATRVSHGEEMLRLACDKQRVLMVGHLLEYHGAVLRLKELVEQGELGEVEYVYSNRLNMGRVRQEENALWSFAPHDVAVLLLLLDSMPIQVTAVGGCYLQPNIADVTMTNLLFDSGVRGHIFVSWLHPFKEQKLVVVGSKAMAVFNDVVSTGKLLLYPRDVSVVDGALVAHRVEGTSVEYAAVEPLRSECEHFVDCVTHRRQPRTDGLNGLRVLSVLQASQRSIQINGEPVTLRANLQEIMYA